ncbi:MAG: excinuclease ABC subunit UvrC [Eubacteriales bacterium]
MADNIQALLEKARELPASPGVYIMKDKDDKIIYVGKATSLRSRVSSYFQSPQTNPPKTAKLVENARELQVIVTDTVLEALVLENTLIKQHTPKYNIKLKDDKNYPYVRVSVHKEYPVVSVERKRGADKGRYFGPYTGINIAYNIKNTVQKTFGLPSCVKKFPQDIGKGRPCLNYHIHQCCGLCTGTVQAEEYRALVDDALIFLKGDYDKAIDAISAKMDAAAEDLNFEAAARYRDRISSLKKLCDVQKVAGNPDTEYDAVALYTEEQCAVICVLGVRAGKLCDSECFAFSADEIIDENALRQFLDRFYQIKQYIPKLILINAELDDGEIRETEEYLSEASGRRVKLHRPVRGELKKMLGIALSNASQYASRYKADIERDDDLMYKIASMLGLETLPDRVEAYDVSNHGSDKIVCGMIVALQTKLAKSQYRTFNIKGQEGQDDYASMREAISRRLDRALSGDGDESLGTLPDLIMLDGGVGHVSVIRQLMEEKRVNIPVFGMVKDSFHKTRVLTDGENEINIAKQQSVFAFFYKLQEEVHRYSFRNMDKGRRKTVKTSSLEKIDGIGPAKAKRLLEHFKNLQAIKSAGMDELSAAKGISSAEARSIYEYFHKTEDTNNNNGTITSPEDK